MEDEGPLQPYQAFPISPSCCSGAEGVSLRWGWGSVSWAGGLKVSSGHSEFSLQGTDLKKHLRMFLPRPWREGTQLPQPCSYSSPHLTLPLMQGQTNFKDRGILSYGGGGRAPDEPRFLI